MEQADPPPDKKYHHGNLRVVLLQIARQLLEEKGVEAVGLREVARAAGVSPNAPYRHFADKEALLVAVAAQGFEELLSSLKSSGSDATEPEKYVAGCRAYVVFATSHTAVTQLMFDSFSGKFGLYPGLKKAADDCLNQFLSMVSRQHDLPRHSDEAFTCAISVWSLLHGYAMLKSTGALEFPRQDLLPTLEQLAAMIVPPHEPGLPPRTSQV